MELSHELLLKLGFIQVPDRPYRYGYKGITGRFDAEHGIFVFHGLSAKFYTIDDIIYMTNLIDYQAKEDVMLFGRSDN